MFQSSDLLPINPSLFQVAFKMILISNPIQSMTEGNWGFVPAASVPLQSVRLQRRGSQTRGLQTLSHAALPRAVRQDSTPVNTPAAAQRRYFPALAGQSCDAKKHHQAPPSRIRPDSWLKHAPERRSCAGYPSWPPASKPKNHPVVTPRRRHRCILSPMPEYSPDLIS